MKSFHPWLVVKRLASGTALIAASLAITLLALEIGLRLWDGVAIFSMLNFVGLELDKLHRPGAAGGVDYDAYVGWTQAANLSTANFTTGEHGARMPSTKIVPLQRGAILMVGNSFGAGAEVSDARVVAGPIGAEARNSGHQCSGRRLWIRSDNTTGRNAAPVAQTAHAVGANSAGIR